MTRERIGILVALGLILLIVLHFYRTQYSPSDLLRVSIESGYELGEPIRREVIQFPHREVNALHYDGLVILGGIASFYLYGPTYRLHGRDRIGVGSTMAEVERALSRRNVIGVLSSESEEVERALLRPGEFEMMPTWLMGINTVVSSITGMPNLIEAGYDLMVATPTMFDRVMFIFDKNDIVVKIIVDTVI